MNEKSLTNTILSIFSSSPKKTYNYKQLAKLLNINDQNLKHKISEILEELQSVESIEEVSRGKYRLKAKSGYATGKIEISRHGYARLATDEITEEIQIPIKGLHGAVHGDLVKIYLRSKPKQKFIEGEVVTIIERSKETYVGVLEVSKSYAFLVPNHKIIPYDIFIPFGKLKGGKDGQKAICRITDWSGKARNPFGEIIEVLGNAGDHETEIHSIMMEFDLPMKFPDEVEEASDHFPDIISEAEIMRRRDMREVTTFTIDPHDAKDFDDALSIVEKKDGKLEIGIHIADVTHYVDEGSVLDNEAYYRGTSVYLVDRVVPMIPERLSNYICSLRPKEDKLCYSAVFELDEEGRVSKEWFGRTIIHSDRRFNYQEAQKIIDEQEGDYCKELTTLNDMAKKMRDRRFKNGAIAFERSEVKFRLDENNKPAEIYFKEPIDTNHLIEEFMLLANRKVATILGQTTKDYKPGTSVYRIHDRPDPYKLMEFSGFVRKLGHQGINTDGGKNTAKTLNALLKDVQGKTEQDVIENLAIRSMSKAVYSVKNIGHYGLGFDYYTHFTSPIRRYPDMMVHRLLTNYLEGKSIQQKLIYEKKCKHTSEREQRAAEAERASVKYKQVEFMADKVGQVFEGIISGVTKWGLYVEIKENKIEGMISLKDLDDDYYSIEEDGLSVVGKYTGHQYFIGDHLTVIIDKVNLNRRLIDMLIYRGKDDN
jgi:ribonuclease R